MKVELEICLQTRPYLLFCDTKYDALSQIGTNDTSLLSQCSGYCKLRKEYAKPTLYCMECTERCLEEQRVPTFKMWRFWSLLCLGGWDTSWNKNIRCGSARADNMLRGCGWFAEKLPHLTQEWLFASKDSVTNIFQRFPSFRPTLFDQYKALGPALACEKTYDGRTAKFGRAKLDEISADA